MLLQSRQYRIHCEHGDGGCFIILRCVDLGVRIEQGRLRGDEIKEEGKKNLKVEGIREEEKKKKKAESG